MISDNVEFLPPIFYAVFWQPFGKCRIAPLIGDLSLCQILCLYHHPFRGTYKVRNEIENEINENETKRNQQKRNEINEMKRNKTKPTKAKRNQRKQNEIRC